MAEDSLTDPSKASIPGLSIDDINPSIYEGGFKTWECAVDLAKYLLHRSQTGSILHGENMRVIEVGLIYTPHPKCQDVLPRARIEVQSPASSRLK